MWRHTFTSAISNVYTLLFLVALTLSTTSQQQQLDSKKSSEETSDHLCLVSSGYWQEHDCVISNLLLNDHYQECETIVISQVIWLATTCKSLHWCSQQRNRNSSNVDFRSDCEFIHVNTTNRSKGRKSKAVVTTSFLISAMGISSLSRKQILCVNTTKLQS